MDTAAVYRIAAGAGFTGNNLVIATAVAMAESAGNPSTVADIDNPSPGCKSIGLWQINICPGRETDPIFAEAGLFDPARNALAAKKRQQQQGWNAWTVTRPSNAAGYARYQRYLSEARAVQSGNLGNIEGNQAGFQECLRRARASYVACMGYDPDNDIPDPGEMKSAEEQQRCWNVYNIDREQCARMYQGIPLTVPNTDPCGQCGVNNLPACVACVGSELTQGLKSIGINLLLGVAVAVGVYYLVKD